MAYLTPLQQLLRAALGFAAQREISATQRTWCPQCHAEKEVDVMRDLVVADHTYVHLTCGHTIRTY